MADLEIKSRQRQIVLILTGILVTAVLILVVLVAMLTRSGRSGAPVGGKSASQAAQAVPSSSIAPRETPASPTARSPIPQPGETIITPIPPRRFDSQAEPSVTGPPPEAGQVVPWHQAHEHVGQTITAEGKVIDTHPYGQVCFLNFSNDREGFYVVIFEEAIHSWPQPPQDYFLNKTIRVSGQVYMQKGRPQIRVKNASQIAVEP